MSARLDFLFMTAMAAAARLESGPAFKVVEAAADPADVNLRKGLPWAIVYPLGEDMAASRGGRAATVQRASARLGVLHVISVRDKPGAAGVVDKACGPVAASRERLITWTPDGADGPLALAGGALEDIVDGRMYWLDRYTVEWTVDSQHFNGA